MISSTASTDRVSLTLTPMEISNSPSLVGSELATPEMNGMSMTMPHITVHPGEICHVVLEIKNWDSQVQELRLELTGDFPLQWCQTQVDEAEGIAKASIPEKSSTLDHIDIPAKKSGQVDLWFLVPADYFEAGHSIGEDPALPTNLDFYGRLSAYAGVSSRLNLIEQTQFNLCIRPQSDYSSFLPTVYQEVDFISRLIKIFEEAFDPVVNSFSSMWAHLDPLTAPQALLPFLAHWVDWPLDSQVGVFQQRRLIRRAIEIYRWRGTRKGLRYYLHLYTGLPLDEHLNTEEDKSICITESFSQGCLLGVAQMGRDTILGGGKPYHFQVRLTASSHDAVDETLVRRIIDQEKPAFCTYDLLIHTID